MKEPTIREIQKMLKLIPNNFPVDLEDLKEIFSQDEIRHKPPVANS